MASRAPLDAVLGLRRYVSAPFSTGATTASLKAIVSSRRDRHVVFRGPAPASGKESDMRSWRKCEKQALCRQQLRCHGLLRQDPQAQPARPASNR
jgi:hypothetical protein